MFFRKKKYNNTKEMQLFFNSSDNIKDDLVGKMEENLVLFIESDKPNQYCQAFLIEYIYTKNKGYDNRVVYARINNLGSISNFDKSKKAVDFKIFKDNIDLKTKTKWAPVKKDTFLINHKVFEQEYFRILFTIDFIFKNPDKIHWEFRDPDTQINIKMKYNKNNIKYMLKEKEHYKQIKNQLEIHEMPFEYKHPTIGFIASVGHILADVFNAIKGR